MFLFAIVNWKCKAEKDNTKKANNNNNNNAEEEVKRSTPASYCMYMGEWSIFIRCAYENCVMCIPVYPIQFYIHIY